MGDFNASPACDEMRFWRGEHSLAGKRIYQDTWALCHPGEQGITWAKRNPLTARLAFLERDRRLDYILVSQRDRSGRGEVVDARVVLDVSEGDVFPSDHSASARSTGRRHRRPIEMAPGADVDFARRQLDGRESHLAARRVEADERAAERTQVSSKSEQNDRPSSGKSSIVVWPNTSRLPS